MRKWNFFKRMIAATLAITVLAGCGPKQSNTTTKGSDQQEVETDSAANTSDSTASSEANPLRPDTLDTIKIVLFGEESPRMKQLMENEFQQVFIDEINTKVELMYVPWTENKVGGKVDLMIASGQDFDAAMISSAWAASSVSKGYLQDLTAVTEKYLPDWTNVMESEVCFKPYTFDGKIYAIPIGNKPSSGLFSTVCVRQDIMDELGLTSMTSIEDLNTYLEKAKEKYPNMYATYDYASSPYIVRAMSERNLTQLSQDLWLDQDKKELVNFAESEEFKKAVELYNGWYKKDLIPRDMLTNTVTLPFQAGMVFFFRGSAGSTIIENEPPLKQVIPSAYTKEYFLKPEKPVYKKTYEASAFQVPVTSKKADRVALFVNLLQKNTKLADMFVYGIEGTDYKLENDKIVPSQTDELFYQWMIFNKNISHFDERFPDSYKEEYMNWDQNAVMDASFGFNINYDKIQSQKAQIDTVWTEFALPMLAGVKSYDEGIGELQAALKKAGYDEYLAEIQSQWDAFNSQQN